MKKYGRPNQRRIYSLVKKVTLVDTHTIRFDFGKGYDRETAFILANMPLLPQHAWQGKDFSKTTLTPLLGSGPYQLKTVEAGRRAVFVRNKNYWARDKAVARGMYNFDRLVFDFYRDDTAALQALSANTIDLRREWNAVTWARDYNSDVITNGTFIKGTFKNSRPARARFLVYNMRRPLFKDKRVRQALALVFDFDWLNKNLFLGTQTRVNSLFMNSELAQSSPPAATAFNLRMNLRQAEKLLSQAGYVLKNGIMHEAKTGKPFAFEILLNDPQDEKIALAFARNLERLGIRAQIRTVDTTQYIGRMSQFDFDMTPSFWRNTLSPGTEQAVYWGSAAAAQEGSFNYSGLANPAVDRLIAALTQATERPALVKAAQALDAAIMDEVIGIPLFDAPNDRIAYRATLKFPEKQSLYGPMLESWWYSDAKSDKTIETTK